MNKLCILLLFFSISSKAQTKILMTEKNGVYTIPCKVNGLSLEFIFDTGASDVVISLSEAIFMIKNGYLEQTDIKGSTFAQIANGELTQSTQILLKEIDIQGLKFYDVSALIVHELKAPLLLGQSAIKKLGSLKMNGNELIINNNSKETDNCIFEDIVPFKIGMTDFDISLFCIENNNYQIMVDNYMLSQRKTKDFIDYLKKSVDKGFIVIKKENESCIGSHIMYKLFLVNDYLYKIIVDFGVGSSSKDFSKVIKNFNFLKEIVPETYKYMNEIVIRDTKTNAKIGEGVEFTMFKYDEIKKRGEINKANYISIDYTIKKIEYSNGKSEIYNNAELIIVDLRNTILTNKGY